MEECHHLIIQFLSSIVIDHLQRLVLDRDDIAVIYVYLDYKQQSKQTPLNLMSSLLKQIVQKRTANLDNIRLLRQRHTRPTLDDIRECLKIEISRCFKVFAIIDGLDELSEEDGARSVFLRAIQSLSGLVHFMVTTRDLASIMLHFKDAMRLTIYADDSDVIRYVQSRIPDWYPADLRPTVVDKVAKGTAGM